MRKKLNKIAKDTNFFLKNFINKQGKSKLSTAMKYSLFPGGKKIRSKILVDIGSLLSVDYKNLIIIHSELSLRNFEYFYLFSSCFLKLLD